MLAWIKSTTGMIVLGVTIVGVAFLVWKGPSMWDNYLNNRYASMTASAGAHVDSSRVDVVEADSAHAQGAVLRSSYRDLVASPRVRSNPVAVEVANSSGKVQKSDSTEISKLRGAIKQDSSAIYDLSHRPPPRVPRTVPYVDVLASYSFRDHKVVPMPAIRAGVDYRVVSFAHAKLEVSYEPPPLHESRPEFRVTAGAHITF